MKRSFGRNNASGFFNRGKIIRRQGLNPVILLLLVFLIGTWILGTPDLGHSQAWASSSFANNQVIESPDVDSIIRNYQFSVLYMTLVPNLLEPFDVTLVGPTKDVLQIGPTGAADDSDSNGLDDAAIFYPYLSLNGMSKYGPVTASVTFIHPVWGMPISKGQLEETSNINPGILDVPPYNTIGSVVGYLDLYITLRIENFHYLGNNVYFTKFPIRVQGNFNHSHPQAGDTYFNQNSRELYNMYGDRTPLEIMNFDYTPVVFAYTDLVFPTASGRMLLATESGDLDISLVGNAESFLLTDSNGTAADPDANGLDQVLQIMHSLVVTGTSQLGQVVVSLRPPDKSPYLANWGQVEEQVNNNPGILDLNPFIKSGLLENWLSNGFYADSFFDVYITIQIFGDMLHNTGRLRINGVISDINPMSGESFDNEFELPLYDEDDILTRNILKEMILVLNPQQIMLPLVFR